MFKNYLKLAFRSLFRSKNYWINIFGLAIALACFIIIALWVQDELSFDKFHKNVDNLYRVTWKEKSEQKYSVLTPAPLAGVLKNNYSQITNSARYTKIPVPLFFNYKGKNLQAKVSFADPEFLKIFTFPFIQGDQQTALNEPFSIICTEEMAKKYFPNINPLGKILTFQLGNNLEFRLKVTGVIKNIPHNSHIQTSAIISFDFWKSIRDLNYWGDSFTTTYLFIKENQNIKSIERKIENCMGKYMGGGVTSGTQVFLQPVKDIHLYSNFRLETNTHGDIKYIYLFAVIALFILIIACINFMNISTAHSLKRAKEIGVRKVIGGKKIDIIFQFLGESFCFLLLAFILAIILAELSLPYFSSLTGKNLIIDYLSGQFILGAIIILFITTVFSAGYPAFFLSSFMPIKVLKDNINLTSKGNIFRKALVALQFSLSIIIIIGSFVVYNQIKFMRNANLGYNKENLIYVKMSGDMAAKYEAVKNDLRQYPNIISATANEFVTGDIRQGTSSISWEGKQKNNVIMQVLRIDYDFLKTYDIKMVKGRFYSKDFSTDATNAYVVNEAAVKAMGMKSPVGKQFKLWGCSGKIIGVIKDFHFKSLHNNIEPLILWPNTKKNFSSFSYITMRVKAEDMQQTISFIKNLWKRYSPNYPFEFKLFDETLDAQYRSEQRVGKVLMWFTLLAILISSLGLLGLISLMIEQRIKEIGIRKILGASVFRIVRILLKDFILWILLANVIAWPIAWITMNKWVQNFAYHINISLWIFLFSGTLALVIALLTVSFQTVRAASANPVESIKYE